VCKRTGSRARNGGGRRKTSGTARGVLSLPKETKREESPSSQRKKQRGEGNRFCVAESFFRMMTPSNSANLFEGEGVASHAALLLPVPFALHSLFSLWPTF
jgi:hypothetical protein